MIIDVLRREHRNIEKLLAVLEQELRVFDRGGRPDYEVIRAVIGYFQVYLEVYHHPQEDRVLARLKARDPAAAVRIGDLAADHRVGSERLRRVTRAIESVLMDREVARATVNAIMRDFITHERQHVLMEERRFFPVAARVLQPDDWAEITSSVADRKDPLFSDAVEERFEAVRRHILQLEQEAEAQRA